MCVFCPFLFCAKNTSNVAFFSFSNDELTHEVDHYLRMYELVVCERVRISCSDFEFEQIITVSALIKFDCIFLPLVIFAGCCLLDEHGEQL